MKTAITITLLGMLLLPLAAAAQPAPAEDQEKQEKQDEQKFEAEAKAAATKAKAEAARVAERAKAEAQRAKAETERAMASAKAHAFTYWLPRKTEKAAYLGVSTSPVAPALREQLKLGKGVGLVVDFVEPDSPAAAAGIKEYDVIQKLDDQLLINNHQLAVLVRTHKAGDSVTLGVIHQGQPGTVTAKLVEKEVAVLDDNNPWGTPPEMWRMPPVKTVPFGQFNEYKAATTRAAKPARVGVERSGRSENLFISPDGSGVRIVAPNPDGSRSTLHASVIRLAEPDQTITLNCDDGHTQMVVTDFNGRVRFDGPVDTEEQRKALPQDLRRRLNEMGLETAPALPLPPLLPAPATPPAAPAPPAQPAPPAPPVAVPPPAQ
jgi:hypothetical protein